MAASFDKPAESLSRNRCPAKTIRRARTVWDKSTYEALVLQVGAGKMDDSLRLFSAVLGRSLAVLLDDGGDVARQRYEVHDLASTSGFLGFSDLFRACLKLLAGKGVPKLRRAAVVAEIRMAVGALMPHLTKTSRSRQVDGREAVSCSSRVPIFA